MFGYYTRLIRDKALQKILKMWVRLCSVSPSNIQVEGQVEAFEISTYLNLNSIW